MNLQIMNDPRFAALRAEPDGVLAPRLGEVLAQMYGVPAEKIIQMAAAEAARIDAGNVATPSLEPVAGDLLTEEWEAFLAPQEETDDRDRFITRSVATRRGRRRRRAARAPPLRPSTPYPAGRPGNASSRSKSVDGLLRLEPSGHLVKPDLDQRSRAGCPPSRSTERASSSR